MSRVVWQGGDHDLELDLCTLCRAVWFDRAEQESVPQSPPPPAEKPLSPKAREELALAKVRLDEQLQREEDLKSGYTASESWHWIPGILGLPVESDAPAVASRPYVTWGVAALLVLVFAATVWDLQAVVEQWGFVPALAYRHGGLTVLTSFLLHAGLLHVLANTYFLLVFGDNVEDHLGRLGLVALLLGSHAAGVVLHAWLDPNGQMPLVGASAGLFGVLGYYVIMFPMARIGILFRVFIYIRWLHMPAFVFVALYLVIQILGSLAQVSGMRGVSYLGHLGGLAVGLAVGLVVHVARRRRPAFLREA